MDSADFERKKLPPNDLWELIMFYLNMSDTDFKIVKKNPAAHLLELKQG
jgi:hypothetical protein